jgi:hypothetical protein
MRQELAYGLLFLAAAAAVLAILAGRRRKRRHRDHLRVDLFDKDPPGEGP